MSIEVKAGGGVTVDSNVATTLGPDWPVVFAGANGPRQIVTEAGRTMWASYGFEDDEAGEFVDSIADIEEQVAAPLKAELRRQWEYNHSEHCSNDWPHPPGVTCHWSLPVELQ